MFEIRKGQLFNSTGTGANYQIMGIDRKRDTVRVHRIGSRKSTNTFSFSYTTVMDKLYSGYFKIINVKQKLHKTILK